MRPCASSIQCLAALEFPTSKSVQILASIFFLHYLHFPNVLRRHPLGCILSFLQDHSLLCFSVSSRVTTLACHARVAGSQAPRAPQALPSEVQGPTPPDVSLPEPCPIPELVRWLRQLQLSKARARGTLPATPRGSGRLSVEAAAAASCPASEVGREAQNGRFGCSLGLESPQRSWQGAPSCPGISASGRTVEELLKPGFPLVWSFESCLPTFLSIVR